MTATKDDKRLELIAQLLAKAESTTPEEAEALTEHAERLMIKYGIDQALINERRSHTGHTGEDIVEKAIVFDGVYARELVRLGGAVAHALGNLRPLKARNRHGSEVLYLVGYESDVAQGELLVRSLHVQALVAMRSWWDEHRTLYTRGTEHDRRRARFGFLRGFSVGVAERITDNRHKVVSEAGTGTELVLVSRKQRVDEHVDGRGYRKGRAPRSTDSLGAAGGYRAGLEANTGERAVTH
ncbi:MAG: DUF2786 domain-containing protein [Microbacterium gubbeenense]|uniref:DUF2786 domain-containing protein n=1 Tax=Microbacterium gubbeenense TaxID=159896 RepID=UPI003F9A2540